MNAQLDIAWRADNQRLLGAEFARLRALLGDGDVPQCETALSELRTQLASTSSIDTLAQLFALNAFERDLLLLVVAVELDPHIAELCSSAQSQPVTGVSFALAASLFANAQLGAIAPLESLRRWRLLEIDTSRNTTDARLRVDERVLFFISGLNYLDHRLHTFFRPLSQHTLLMAEAHQQVIRHITQVLDPDQAALPSIFLEGDDRDSQLDVAIAVAESLGATLHVVHTADLPDSLSEQEGLIALWHREAALLASGLVIIHDAESDRVLHNFVERVQGFVIVAGAAAISLEKDSCTYRIDKPDTRSQQTLWRTALGDNNDELPDLNNLANQYRLNARRIDRIAQQAQQGNGQVDKQLLHRLCSGDARPMHALAQRIDSTTDWHDLVLPEGQLRILQQLVSHTRHRMTVHYDWGFANKTSRGLGMATLFSGESGTGKTMAAEVVANALGLALYRIDLSAVVSKYIGETEKNLKKLFDAAEDTGAVLLFDEADALFGKRSDVKDSHDRYANIEVSYLLQRMEAYRGLAVLTSNHRTALDVAFQRRLRFIIDFPFPDAKQREAIWRSIFPSATPLANLDYTMLARLNVTGGSIRNIALNAAFMAADASTPVNMTHIQRAAQLEVGKSERTLSAAETRGWV